MHTINSWNIDLRVLHAGYLVEPVRLREINIMRTYENTKYLLLNLRHGGSGKTREIDHLVDIYDRITRKMKKE
jgi:hypothetical protein